MEKKNLFDLSGKIAIVTGGSRGIGKTFAHTLAAAGANVCIVNTNIETGKVVAEELASEYGVETIAVQADISDYAQVNEMVERVVERFGTIDICVANAGIVIRDLAENFNPEDWNRVMDVNLNGVFFTNQAVGRVMLEKERGSIINITSIRAHTATHPHPGCAYPTAKAGVHMMTKSLAKEWAKRNVRVNSICPGYMRTDIVNKIKNNIPDWEALTAMERIGEPEEMSTALLYLASDASSFTTGSEVVVDGGYLTF